MNKSQQEIDLYIKYQHAITNLDQGKIEQGMEQLRFLLQNSSILKEQNSKGVLYGIYLSLAEILGRSERPSDKCEALRYYHESNKIIEDCWQTFRKMSIIFRQLGLIPRALNSTIKALQTCKQSQIQPSLLYQACCLCFLINEQDQFVKYNKLIPNEDVLKKPILELEEYFNEHKVTNFVRNLLNEQALIQHKLQQIPQQSFDQDFFLQQYDCELKIDLLDLNKFFRKIKRIFQSNVEIDTEKLVVTLKDTSIFSKTSITVTNKMGQFSICPAVFLNGSRSAFVKYDKTQTMTPKLKEIQSIQPKFEEFVLKHFQPLLQSIKFHIKCEGIDFFNLTTCSEQAFGIKFDKEDVIMDKKENLIGRFLVEKLNQTRHLTVIHLINQLTILMFKEFQPKLKTQEKIYSEVARKLIKCLIWAQFSINEFSKDPFINLEILDIAILGLQKKLHFDKQQSVQQKVKIKIYQQLIKRLKHQLMFEIDIKAAITDPEIYQTYTKRYIKTMTQLHSDSLLLQEPQNEMTPDQIQQCEMINKFKMHRQSKQTIEGMIQKWRQKNKKLEMTEKIIFQVRVFKEILSKEIQAPEKLRQIKQIVDSVVRQFFFQRNSKEFLDAVELFSPILNTYFQILQNDAQIGLISLKIAFLTAYFQCDFSQPLSHFIKVCVPLTKFPLRQAFEIDIFRTPFLNYIQLFENLDINFILNDFIELRMQMLKKNTEMMTHFSTSFEDDQQLMLYLLQFIKEKEGLYSDCIVQRRVARIEVKNNNPEPIAEPNEFSSDSENEFENPNIFFKKYRTVNISDEVIENKFQIVSKIYEYTPERKQFLLNHLIQINMGNPSIRKQMRKFVKQVIKIETGFSMKKLRDEFLLKFFNQFYFSPGYDRQLSDQELQFFASYMPFCLKYFDDFKKCQNFLNNRIKPFILPKINPTILKYQDALYQQFLQKQVQKQQQPPNITELSNLIKNQSLSCHMRANLLYLLYKVDENKDIKLLLLALAHNDTLLFWDRLYMELFQFSLHQLNQKTQNETYDWFISQKKLQVHLNKNPLMTHLFEYRFVMDLLKAQQRQIEYQCHPDAKSFQKVQQAYLFLLQQNQFQIPKDLFELQYNFRAMLLIEKKIVRKYRNITVERMKQNIENFIRLTSLIKQMEQTKFSHYYNAYSCELEVIYDLYVNIYKFVRRFLRHKLYQQLQQFIGILLQLMPQLFNKQKLDQMQYIFPVNSKTYKISHLTPQQIEEENKANYNSERLDALLNNLQSFFQVLASQFNMQKLQKYNIEALYYFLHIQYHNSKKEWILDQIYKQVSQIYKPNTNEFLIFPKILNNNCSENDEVLKYYFNHDLVYEYQKSKILKLIIKILFSQQKWEEIMKLMERLPKNYEIRLQQICTGLIEDYEKMADPDIQKEALQKIHAQINSNTSFFQHFKDCKKLDRMYIDYYDFELNKSKNDDEDDDEAIKISKAKFKLNMMESTQNVKQYFEMMIETKKS